MRLYRMIDLFYCLEEREKMIENYKTRVSSFMKSVSMINI